MDVKNKPQGDNEMVIVRTIYASRERVWEAMTDPKQVGKWWGPTGFTNTLHKHEFRVGGVWEHTMHGPDGKDYPNRAVFTEIVKPERVVYELTGGKKDDPAMTKSASWTLEAQGEKTRLTLRMTFLTKEQRDLVLKVYKAIDGGNQTLDRLVEHLGVKPPFELAFERLIDAPCEKVYDAWTDPKKMSQWFAPKPFQLIVKSMDFRPGGKFDMAMRGPDGNDFPFTGTYRVITPPSLLSWSGEFTSGPAEQMSTTVSFKEEDGKTRLRARQTFFVMTPTIEMATKGANQGWNMTLDQLTEHLLKV